MKGAPWFPFYPADFLGGTFAMDAAEVGAYVRLLCLQWQGGGLPNDHAKLAALSGHAFASAVASKFSRCDDGLLRNARLEDCRKKAYEKSEKATASAVKRWNEEKKDDANAYPNACANAMRGQRSEVRGQNTEEREQSSAPHKPPAKRVPIVDDADAGYPAEFLRIWNAWPQGKRGNKGAALKAWKKAKALRSVDFMLKSIEAHKAHDPKWWEGEYIPHASTWLNQRGFDTDPTPQATPKRFDANGRELF